MALRITYKPGEKQSRQAAQYFNESVGFLVGSMVEDMEEQDYLISDSKDATLRLRTWSPETLSEEELHLLIERILDVRADLEGIADGAHHPDQLAPVATDWLDRHMDGSNVFVELFIGEEEEDPPVFSMGLLRGRAVLISTDTVLFTWLQQNVFGLTLAGKGSYLVELMDDASGRLQQAS